LTLRPEDARPQAPEALRLSPRQGLVLRAVVSAYVGDAAPIGSATLAHLLPVSLSPASVRNTLAELAELGLIEKPHASAGRVPTDRGLRLFVDSLVGPRPLGDYEKRRLAGSVDGVDALEALRVACQLLSQRTQQLGFVLRPRLERVLLRHTSLMRLSSERVLAVLVSSTGVAYRRVIEDAGADDQIELDRIAATLNAYVRGRTLAEARVALAGDLHRLRSEAERLRARALHLAAAALAGSADDADLLTGTWLSLLDQPEFRHPERLRELLAALETRERLIALLDQMLLERGVRVAFGGETDEPGLRHCAIVTAPYGGAEAPLGVLGVIGPSRMDYARIIPLVEFFSQLITEKLSA
jgi:heat-inducible transcriptional repressor